MSVLSLPRIYFQGSSFWNPTTVNNYSYVYDAAKNEVFPYPISENGDSVTNDEELKRYIREINWSVYGESGCGFVTQENREKNGTPDASYITNIGITGGTLENGTYIDNDPLCGKEIQMLGNKFNDRLTAARLVDSNPYGSMSSQIFFSQLKIGDDNTGILGSKYRRMYSYWVGVKRNLDPLLRVAAGQSGGIFQVAIPFEQLDINNGENSQLIEQLREAMQEPGAKGLMMRFSCQTTLYYVNVNPDNPYAPYREENQAALTERFLNGEVFMNPAYSYTVGSIGIWKDGELASTPEGRYLMPGCPVTISEAVNQGVEEKDATVKLGPLLAELDESRSTLSLDALSTIPAYTKEGAIANLGNLTIKAGDVEIATLDYSRYNQAAYNKTAGIIDITGLTSAQISAIQSQPLRLWIDRTNSHKGLGPYLCSLIQEAVKSVERITMPLEEKMTALSDDRSIYIEEGESATCTVRVRDRGGIPPSGTRLFVAQYKWNPEKGWEYVAPDDESRHLDISSSTFDLNAEGTAEISLMPVNPGCAAISFSPFSDTPPSEAPGVSEFTDFSIIRVMPFDNHLDAKPDSELTWEFMYEDVFRVYDLLYPIMSEIIPMNNRKLMEGAWMQIKAVLGDPNIYHEDDPMWHSTMYMSITRDLSKGKRKLLDRWCDLVSRGNQP